VEGFEQAGAAVFIGRGGQVAQHIAAVVLGSRIGERGGIGTSEFERFVIGVEGFEQAGAAVFIGEEARSLSTLPRLFWVAA